MATTTTTVVAGTLHHHQQQQQQQEDDAHLSAVVKQVLAVMTAEKPLYPYPQTVRTHPRICVASVEGGIGAGKTTWIARISAAVKRLAASEQGMHKLHLLVAKEPIDLWIQLGIFGRFLNEPKRWAAPFQNVTYSTRILEWCTRYEEALAIVDKDKEALVLLLLERSPFSDLRFFAELQHEMGNIDSVEWACHGLWFQMWTRNAPSLIDMCVWVATSADEAVKRIVRREQEGKRAGEVAAYDRTYLDKLHGKHVLYLEGGEFCGSPVLRIDGDRPFHECDATLDDMCRTLLAWFDRTLSGRNSPQHQRPLSQAASSSGSSSPAALSSSPPPPPCSQALSAASSAASSTMPLSSCGREDAMLALEMAARELATYQ